MAGKFACDPQEAELFVRELTRVRSDMRLSLEAWDRALDVQTQGASRRALGFAPSSPVAPPAR